MSVIGSDRADPTVERARVGGEVALGAGLFLAGVAMEWVLDPQRANDGSVARPVTFVLCVGTSVAGAAVAARGLHRLRQLLPDRRAARFGHRAAVLGWGLTLVAMLAILVTGLGMGAPHPAAFVPWVLGALLLAVGPLSLGPGIRREQPVPGWSLVVAGCGALASLLVAVDPWHDVSLTAMCVGWVVGGLSLRR